MSDQFDTPADRVFAELLERTGEGSPEPRLEPVQRLAELAGSPQLDYPVIQVAGTNGKTSTSRALATILTAHGLRTGLFTSPHLMDFTERFEVSGEPVDPRALESCWDELQLPLEVVDAELSERGEPRITFFEALAVLAYAVFADAPVDVAVIEVGLGGEWDATNLVDAQVAVFTPISLDHTDLLGDTIEAIARTKSGIVKEGTVLVSTQQAPEALRELEAAAARSGTSLHLAGRDFQVRDDRVAVGGRQVTISGLTSATYDPAFIPLFGQHQAENVALAIAAAEAFFGADRPLPEEVLDEGLARLTSPGRLQLLGTDPVVYVDAAHNPHGAAALAQAVTESFRFEELLVVVGILGDKDASGVLRELAPIAHRVVLTPVDSARSADMDDLVSLATQEIPDTPIDVAHHLSAALDEARAWASQSNGRAVLVTGSVVLAGEAIRIAQTADWGVST